MSFFSSLRHYRPSKPPVVDGSALVSFVQRLQALGVSEFLYEQTCQVKFGSAIDQDDRSSSWEEPVSSGVSVMRDIDWDIDKQCKSLEVMVKLLTKHRKPIYRAYLGLGSLTNAVRDGLRRPPSPENQDELCPDSWSLEIGVIEASRLGGDDNFKVGWIALSASGYGHLYPWVPKDWVDRAAAMPALESVVQLCRETWPVAPTVPTAKQLAVRKQMGDLWPYSRLDLPWDWYWGISESG